jgi:UDP-N-acetylmuramate--alanine ligase
MEHWGTIEALRKGFLDFVSNIPFYGLGRVLYDHPEVQALVGKVTGPARRTFGFNAQADCARDAADLRERDRQFDVILQAEDDRIDGMTLPMPGDHNVSNALAPSRWRGTSAWTRTRSARRSRASRR